jgi:hypothetical protein
VKCQYNEIVWVTKLYSLQRNFVTLKHIKNVTQMFTLAIESNESRGPLRAFTLADLNRTATEQLAESKA